MNQNQEPENNRARSPTKRGMANAVLIDHTYYDYSNHDVSAVKKLLAGADVASGAESSAGGPELNEVADSQIKKKCPTPQVQKKKGRVTFPSKLHSILSNANYCDIIRWMPHGRSWKIFDKDRLASVVCKETFNHNSFDSFNRSVNGWGFKRLMKEGPDCKSYYSELFLRGRPELAKLMTRLVNPGKRIPDPKGEPNFYEISKKYPLPLDPTMEDAASYNLNRNQKRCFYDGVDERTSHLKSTQSQHPQLGLRYDDTIRAHASRHTSLHWSNYNYNHRNESHIPQLTEYGHPSVSTHSEKYHSAHYGDHYNHPYCAHLRDPYMQPTGAAQWPQDPYRNYPPGPYLPYLSTREHNPDHININVSCGNNHLFEQHVSAAVGGGQGLDENSSNGDHRRESHGVSIREDDRHNRHHPPKQHDVVAKTIGREQDEKPSGEWFDHRLEIHSTNNQGYRDNYDLQCCPHKKCKTLVNWNPNNLSTTSSLAAPSGPSDSRAISYPAVLKHKDGTKKSVSTNFLSDGFSKTEYYYPTVMEMDEAVRDNNIVMGFPTGFEEGEPPALPAGIVASNHTIPAQLPLIVDRSECLFEPWRKYIEGIHNDKTNNPMDDFKMKETVKEKTKFKP